MLPALGFFLNCQPWELSLMDVHTAVPKEPTINLAIGPACPVRCEGCYNHFGNTSSLGGLITANEVVAFARSAQAEGVSQATLSGGDPLFHPEIVAIARGVRELGLKVKLDTVGTALLGSARVVFKGRGRVAKIEAAEISSHVDFVNIPLDGARQETAEKFRRGRANLFAETREVARLIRAEGIKFGFNTVANASNLNELPMIRNIAEEDGAAEWQVFEYDPSGPNPTTRKSQLKLEPGQFALATSDLESTSGRLRVVCKSLEARTGAYFLVDDSGHAWKPVGGGMRHVFGHVTHDRELVVAALRQHIRELQQRT
jgi:MoaA/NifB/PqqE/SkfB family radical SAM enzyme